MYRIKQVQNYKGEQLKLIKLAAIYILILCFSTLSSQSIKSVKFFEHANYQGGSMNYTTDRANLTQLRARSGSWNDKISSMVIPPNWSVTIYEHTNYQGRSLTLRGNQSNLSSKRGGPNRGTWNDAISSFRIRKGKRQSKPISGQKKAWQPVGFPSAANGVWIGDRGGRITLSNQSINNGSNTYRIERVMYNNGIYKFITNWSGYYYSWFMRFGNNNDSYWFHNRQYYNSANAAYGAAQGNMLRYSRANQGRAVQPSNPNRPSNPSRPNMSQSNKSWTQSSLPSNLTGRFRKSGNSAFTINNRIITQGSSTFQVIRVFKRGDVYKVITTSNGYHVAMFIQYDNSQFIRFIHVNKAYNSFGQANAEPQPNMKGHFSRAFKQ